MKKIIIALAAVAAAFGASAQTNWLHIYEQGNHVTSNPLEDITSIKHRQQAGSDTTFTAVQVTTVDGKTENVGIASIDSIVMGTNIPTMYIDIAGGAEVVEKDRYLNAVISVKGWEGYPDFEATDVTIKGRGNSTWNMDKKPYRLKFSKKQTLCGMTKAKNYALIANHIDCTLMRNVMALKLGQMLGLEYTNHFVPVNLVMNGTYRGQYLLTEKIGINGASVDIDENTGILFELDTNYDEPYKFHSNKFGVPVMVKDPDFDELVEADPSLTQSQLLDKWRNEFHALENTLNSGGAPSADFVNQMDVSTLAKYILVFAVSRNEEPNHPKSVYLYKEEAGVPFKMGPIWDFDWAFTFNGSEGTGAYNSYLISGYSVGSQFFKAMLRSPEVMELYAQEWANFRDNIWPELHAFMDDYAAKIRVSALQNGEIWYTGRPDSKYSLLGTDQFDENYATLIEWLTNRINWLDSAQNYGLYR